MTLPLANAGGSCAIDRMSPAAGGLRARRVTIDGLSVAADGTWPGFRPATCDTRIRLAPGEVAVVRTA
jgi:hypothetical protein